jgi:hypothetical protein
MNKALIYFILSIALFNFNSFGQTIMNVYQNNGSVLQIPVNTIDSITYSMGNIGNVAQVITVNVANITSSSASIESNILSDGGAAITQRGVCWGINQNPTITNDLTIDGSGIGLFNSVINGILQNFTYYVRAYAINANGIYYGNEISFSTLNGLPIVMTQAYTDLKATSVNASGSVFNDGGSQITSKGICWSPNPNPTINDFITNEGGGLGSFSSSLTGLIENTKYYYKAYAFNVNGVSYGNEFSFTTKDFTYEYIGVYLGNESCTINGNRSYGITISNNQLSYPQISIMNLYNAGILVIAEINGNSFTINNQPFGTGFISGNGQLTINTINVSFTLTGSFGTEVCTGVFVK